MRLSKSPRFITITALTAVALSAVITAGGSSIVAQGGAKPDNAVVSIRGDVNCDGMFDGSDVLAILREVAGLSSDAGCSRSANVECSDPPDVRDALAALFMLAGSENGPATCALTPSPVRDETRTATPTATPWPATSESPTATGAATDAPSPTPTRADDTPPSFAGLKSAITCIPGPIGGGRTARYNLSWDPATDNVSPSKNIVYDVYQANTSGGEDFSKPTYTTSADSTSFTTPPLATNKYFYFVVRARDQASNTDSNKVEREGQNLCV